MQSVDGDEDEQPSSALQQSHIAGGESTQMDRPAASKHSVVNLPPLVPDDKELETEELKRFRGTIPSLGSSSSLAAAPLT
jgi:hypothetical protein